MLFVTSPISFSRDSLLLRASSSSHPISMTDIQAILFGIKFNHLKENVCAFKTGSLHLHFQSLSLI